MLAYELTLIRHSRKSSDIAGAVVALIWKSCLSRLIALPVRIRTIINCSVVVKYRIAMVRHSFFVVFFFTQIQGGWGQALFII